MPTASIGTLNWRKLIKGIIADLEKAGTLRDKASSFACSCHCHLENRERPDMNIPTDRLTTHYDGKLPSKDTFLWILAIVAVQATEAEKFDSSKFDKVFLQSFFERYVSNLKAHEVTFYSFVMRIFE